MNKERECDQHLVDLAKAGCQKSFDMLVVKYQRRLWRVITYVVFDKAQAEDLVQESFILAYRGLANFRGDSAFFTWLYKIGVNTAKNFLAKEARRHTTSVKTSGKQHLPFTDADNMLDMNTPDSMLESKQLNLAIYSAIKALPMDERTCLVLRELEGFSYDEIAKIMQCPTGTIRSRIFRAREAIVREVSPLLDSSRIKRL